jgi:hypothetical protein
VSLVKSIDEGLEDFEVDPDPVHQQQRRSDAVARSDSYPQRLAIDDDGTLLVL